MRGVGTDEPWHLETLPHQLDGDPRLGVAVHYRKPLRIDEVNQMAPTPDVLERRGRP
jgi:hypothetical protein